MKLAPGEKLSEITLPSIEGSEFSIKKIKGKKTLLTFYRFATCPFCNLRIHEIIKRYSELGENFEMVAIFNSSPDYLAKKMGKHMRLLLFLQMKTLNILQNMRWKNRCPSL